jgi:hypothetical protein
MKKKNLLYCHIGSHQLFNTVTYWYKEVVWCLSKIVQSWFSFVHFKLFGRPMTLVMGDAMMFPKVLAGEKSWSGEISGNFQPLLQSCEIYPQETLTLPSVETTPLAELWTPRFSLFFFGSTGVFFNSGPHTWATLPFLFALAIFSESSHAFAQDWPQLAILLPSPPKYLVLSSWCSMHAWPEDQHYFKKSSPGTQKESSHGTMGEWARMARIHDSVPHCSLPLLGYSVLFFLEYYVFCLECYFKQNNKSKKDILKKKKKTQFLVLKVQTIPLCPVVHWKLHHCPLSALSCFSGLVRGTCWCVLSLIVLCRLTQWHAFTHSRWVLICNLSQILSSKVRTKFFYLTARCKQPG